MFRLRYLLFAVLIGCFSGCIKNNPDPSWLEINKWTLQSNVDLSGAEGELTQNISEAWVYVNDEIIGVFQLPCKVPILKSGDCNIKVYPAIKNNGISATKKIYPFLEVFELNAKLNENEVLTLNPKTRYKSITRFKNYDFESTSLPLENDPNTSLSKISFSNSNLEWFNGNYYGKVELNKNDSTWVAYTTDQLYFSKGKEVYLELDYYNTNSLVTGLIFVNTDGTTNNNLNIKVNQQENSTVKWKKIYIDLRELIANSPQGSNFLQSFQASIDSGKSTAEIRLDNIKLVYFD
jgi:hypothetical protein